MLKYGKIMGPLAALTVSVCPLSAATDSEPARLAAAQDLWRADHGAASKTALVNALKSSDASFRQKLARALIAYAAPKVTAETLAPAFGELPEDTQLALLNNIANLQAGENYQPLLEAGLQTKSAGVQLAALEALGTSGNVKYVGVLTAALKDSDNARNKAAVSALSRLHGNGVAAAITRQATAADADSKPKWLEVVAQRADHDALPLMAELAKSPQPEVRAAAFAALKNIAGAGDLPLLVSLQSAATAPADKKSWREALLKAAKSRAGDADAVKLLRPLAEKAAPEEVQIFAGALAALDCQEAADVFNSPALLLSPDANRRKDIIRAISNTRNKTALALLETAAAAAQDDAEKILALRGVLDTAAKVDLPLKDKLKVYEQAWQQASRAEEQDAIISALKAMKKKEADQLLAKLGA